MKFFLSLFILAAAGVAMGDCQALLNPPPLVLQTLPYSCGLASLKSWLEWHGFTGFTEQDLIRPLRSTAREGTDAEQFVVGIRELGFRARYEKNISIPELRRHLREGRGVILNIRSWGQGHWVLLYNIGAMDVRVMDPETGHRRISLRTLQSIWYGPEGPRTAVVIEPRR